MLSFFSFLPSFLASLLTPLSFFPRDIFPRIYFFLFGHSKVCLSCNMNESGVQWVGASIYCILTLWLLVYWEAVSLMTTVLTNLMIVRPPVGSPWFFLGICVDCVGSPIAMHLPLCSSCSFATANAKQRRDSRRYFLFSLPFSSDFLSIGSCWFMSWISWM